MRALVAALLAAALLGLAPAPAGAASQTIVVPAASSALPATWHEVFVVGYGAGRSLLGTSRGGDGGRSRLGPDYGAPAADGSWWFLDAAKLRLAHYSAAGSYLGQVKIPRPLLVHGQYFQWQLPHVLRDGTLVAARQGPTGTYLLRLRNGQVDEIAVHGPAVAPTYDDGRLLYGPAGAGRIVAVNPQTGRSRYVSALRTPSGSKFSLTLGHRLKLSQPSGTTSLALKTVSGARAHVGLQLRVGADDVFHLYLVGVGADDDSTQLVGATSVGPSGAVGPVEALPNPFSDADTGSPAQLELAPGSSTPMLVYVLPDGVHVYARTG